MNLVPDSDTDNKRVKRSRKKSSYRKINNEARQKLIEMVYLKDFLLKDAAKNLNINYSTAKTILRIFRLEKRISKKNTPDLNCLKSIKQGKSKKFQIIRNFKHESDNNFHGDVLLESVSNTTFMSNSTPKENGISNKSPGKNVITTPNVSENIKSEVFNGFDFSFANKAEDNLLLQTHNLNNNLNNNLIILNNNLSQFFPLLENMEHFNNYFFYLNFSNKITNLTNMINVCSENLKQNQNMINVIMHYLNFNVKNP